MQLTAKIKNKSTAWSATLKVRALDVVTDSGNFYQNISGINGALTDTTSWFLIKSGITVIPINKIASDISGADPDFQLSLAGTGIAAFPASMRVYIDLTNSGDFEPLDPVNYNPVTQILHSMNDPAAYPNQKIKIMAI